MENPHHLGTVCSEYPSLIPPPMVLLFMLLLLPLLLRAVEDGHFLLNMSSCASISADVPVFKGLMEIMVEARWHNAVSAGWKAAISSCKTSTVHSTPSVDKHRPINALPICIGINFRPCESGMLKQLSIPCNKIDRLCMTRINDTNRLIPMDAPTYHQI